MNEQLKYLNDNNFFRVDDFMQYLKSEFPNCIDNHWNYNLVMNVLNMAADQYNTDANEFLYFVSNILPEITYDEIRPFAHYAMTVDKWKDTDGND